MSSIAKARSCKTVAKAPREWKRDNMLTHGVRASADILDVYRVDLTTARWLLALLEKLKKDKKFSKLFRKTGRGLQTVVSSLSELEGLLEFLGSNRQRTNNLPFGEKVSNVFKAIEFELQGEEYLDAAVQLSTQMKRTYMPQLRRMLKTPIEKICCGVCSLNHNREGNRLSPCSRCYIYYHPECVFRGASQTSSWICGSCMNEMNPQMENVHRKTLHARLAVKNDKPINEFVRRNPNGEPVVDGAYTRHVLAVRDRVKVLVSETLNIVQIVADEDAQIIEEKEEEIRELERKIVSLENRRIGYEQNIKEKDEMIRKHLEKLMEGRRELETTRHANAEEVKALKAKLTDSFTKIMKRDKKLRDMENELKKMSRNLEVQRDIYEKLQASMREELRKNKESIELSTRTESSGDKKRIEEDKKQTYSEYIEDVKDEDSQNVRDKETEGVRRKLSETVKDNASDSQNDQRIESFPKKVFDDGPRDAHRNVSHNLGDTGKSRGTGENDLEEQNLDDSLKKKEVGEKNGDSNRNLDPAMDFIEEDHQEIKQTPPLTEDFQWWKMHKPQRQRREVERWEPDDFVEERKKRNKYIQVEDATSIESRNKDKLLPKKKDIVEPRPKAKGRKRKRRGPISRTNEKRLRTRDQTRERYASTEKVSARENDEEKSERSSSSDLEDGVYEVEKILGVRGKGKNVEYLVKWKGYDDTENTWESRKNMACEGMITQFLKRRKLEKLEK
mmetsp:Transcript_14960/g.22645  ORF Transcript_14960/g.22645 Transcript_14960/m.22645 type:complete len:731 (-) Transcript_14960:276-2468(-)